MIENANKFFIYDRWFYFKKEVDNIRTYTTMIEDIKNGLMLTFNKDNNEVEIISIKDDEFVAKLYITDITKKEISFHYKENIPQEIYIENDLYVNLLLEAFIDTKYGRIDKESVIRISKKRNLDKILYQVPPLPLDEDLYMDKYKIQSDMLDYFLKLIDSFNIFTQRLKQTQEEKPKKISEVVIPTITNIEIPQELQIYDRKYTFQKKDYTDITYINNQGGLHKLEIKIDPKFNSLMGIREDSVNDKDQRFIFSAFYNENSNVRVNFSSTNKVLIRLNYTDNINSYIMFEGIYNEKAKALDTIIKLEKNNRLLTLKPHPIFSNVYVDENGNEYNIANQDFSRLSGMASLSPFILNTISNKVLTKK